MQRLFFFLICLRAEHATTSIRNSILSHKLLYLFFKNTMATNNAGEPRPIVVVAMMMMMMATVVVALPPTTFPPPYTTFPPGCQTDDGDVLRPGEHSQSNDGGCKMCFCSWDGQLSCYYADCIVAMCVDQVKSPGACCARCPNGKVSQLFLCCRY